MRHWSAQYVGTPYLRHGRSLAGCDCWGMFRMVFCDQLGIVLPDDETISPDDAESFSDRVRAAIGAGDWIEVDRPRELDGALFRRGMHDAHVGVMLDARQMLHSDERSGAARVERIDTSAWSCVFVGFFRHRDTI